MASFIFEEVDELKSFVNEKIKKQFVLQSSCSQAP